MRITLQHGTSLAVTAHALTRYNERICPGLDRAGALEHLARLAALVGEATDRPDWSLADQQYHPGDRYWIALGPDIGLVVAGLTAITVLCRGCVSETETHRRRQRRVGRKAMARYQIPRAERARARRRRRDDRAPEAEDEAA